MIRNVVRWISAVIAWAAFAGAASAQAPPRLLQDLSAPDAAVREAAVEQLALLGAEAVEPLSRTAAGEDHTAAAGARLALSLLVHRACAPGKDPRVRAAVSAALLREVKKAGYTEEHRRWLLRFVAFAACEADLSELAALLPDPTVGEMALFALARIPGDAANRVLAAALEQASPERKVGLLLALSHRGDARLVPVLLEALKDIHPPVRRAAREGLGRSADPEAVPVLKDWAFREDEEEIRWSRDAYFTLAENLLRTGRKDLALALYELMFRHGPEIQDRCAGLRGWVHAGAWDRVRVLREVMQGARDPQLAGTALELLAGLEGEEASHALIDLAPVLSPPLRIHLFHALERRGDRAGRSVLEEGLASGGPALAAAAAEALGKLGDPAAAAVLVDRGLASPDGRVREAAEQALVQLPGEAVAAVAAERLARAKDRGMKLALIRVLGTGRVQAALAPLEAALAEPDPEVRLAAVEALGTLDRPEAVPDLVHLLACGDAREAAAARTALARVRSSEAVRAVVDAFSGAPDRVRQGIVEALGRAGDPERCDFFARAARDPSLDVVKAALQALAMTGDSGRSLPVLRAAAESRWPGERAAAVGALVTLGNRVAGRSGPEAALAVYREAAARAERTEEKVALLSALKALGNPRALDLVRPWLRDPSRAVRASAASAAGPYALALSVDPTRAEEAVPLLEAVVKEGDDPDMVNRAVEKLRNLGHAVEIPVRPGYVRAFWVLGPFPGREALRKADVLPAGEVPEPGFTKRPVSWKGKTFAWKRVKVEHLFGRLNLLDAVANKEDAGAYLYTELYAPEAMDARFLMGSDDDLFCWLNGKEVHRFIGGRGWRADQDRVDVHLEKGRNTVLLKVLNGAGGWDVSLKVVDRKGEPLELEHER